jgi:hypothetical protein
MSVAAIATKGTESPSVSTPAFPFDRLHRFSTEQYDRMTQLGMLPRRAELIEGLIVEKLTPNPPHARAVMRLTKHLSRLIPEPWELLVQGPIALKHSRPEPDCAILRGPDSRYASRHARPSEIALLIEVGDSSFLDDRRFRLPLYAAEKIACIWLVNLVQDQIEVYVNPKSGKHPGYRPPRIYKPGEQVPLIIEGKEIARLSVSHLCLLED